jgi:hypothetical protein
MSEKKKARPLQYKITQEGSLGVLAIGAVGVKAWRKFKEENGEQKKK